MATQRRDPIQASNGMLQVLFVLVAMSLPAIAVLAVLGLVVTHL